MHRLAFIAAMAAVSLPRSGHVHAAALRRVDVTPLVAAFPGVVGVYARALSPEVAPVTVREAQPFAAASVVKLPIMLTVYRAYDAGTAAPTDRVKLRDADIIGGSPVLSDAQAGEEHTLRTLVDAMIRESDNTAANTLITAFGFKTINDTMLAAGMTGTHLQRHFADVVPAWRHNLNVTTPRDIGGLLYAIERGAHEGVDTVARTASCRAMVDVLLGQEYRDMIPAGIRRGVRVANKTGELDGVRNDAAIVDPFGDAPYVLVVLSHDDDGDAGPRAAIAAIAHRVDAVFGKS
jgi:beta-lactamase class A